LTAQAHTRNERQLARKQKESCIQGPRRIQRDERAGHRGGSDAVREGGFGPGGFNFRLARVPGAIWTEHMYDMATNRQGSASTGDERLGRSRFEAVDRGRLFRRAKVPN
jgi:hypothetical protein